MGNGDYRAASRKFREGFLNLLFRFGIERRSRFIQQQNWRVLENSACDSKALLLTAGKEAAFVANYCFVTLWLRHNKIVGIGRSRRFTNFFWRRIEPTELDIAEDCVVKQKRLLRDEPHLFAQ